MCESKRFTTFVNKSSMNSKGLKSIEIQSNNYKGSIVQSLNEKDDLIADIYSDVPQGQNFIKRCRIKGKIFMSQLAKSDFKNSINPKMLEMKGEEFEISYKKFGGFLKNANAIFIDDEIIEFRKAIDGSPLSCRAKNCIKRSMVASLEELLMLKREDLMSVRNLGIKTCKEILLFCNLASLENLRRLYLNYYSHETDGAERIKYDNTIVIPILVADTPLSVRAKNCLKAINISTLDDLMLFKEDDLLKIKNLGEKTFREILDYKKTIYMDKTNLPTKSFYIEDIAEENTVIPISMLKNLGISEEGIKMFQNQGYSTVGDLKNLALTDKEYSFGQMLQNYMSIPVSEHFVNEIETLKNNEKICLLNRSKGETLEEIGVKLGLTRERIRQILKRIYHKLLGTVELIASAMLSSNKAAFSFSDINKFFDDEGIALCYKLVLLKSDYIHYFDFAEKYISSEQCKNEINIKLSNIIKNVIGEGINFYDNLEVIESELKKQKLDFFDFEDIMNLLIHKKYRFYGDYVIKGKQSYGIVCYDAVRKFFKFDIKLDSNENNADMKLLRQIIEKHYQGLLLPSRNRALTACMTRDDVGKMILSGRGRYCPIDKAIYSNELFDEIRRFIHNSSVTTLYYSEIFSYFKGRLLTETNVNNHFFLHGMLKYLYPEEFKYERDLLVKHGQTRYNVDERLKALLLDKGCSMTKEEINSSIPGIKDYVLSFLILRTPKIIQWDYNEYNHIENIIFAGKERSKIFNLVKEETALHGGYTSDVLLYNAVKKQCDGFVKRNNINDSLNLYYIISYIFEKDFRFRKPHILSLDFPVEEINIANIAKRMLYCEKDLNFKKFKELGKKLGWAPGTLYKVFSDLKTDYIRISEDDYISKDSFEISKHILNSIRGRLQILVSKTNYCTINSIFNYDEFPGLLYEWNSFLLESIINEFDIGFRVISPQLRDRRFQHGIIIFDKSPYKSLEDLVIELISKEGITSLSESKLLKYLRRLGLVTMNRIPQELYEHPKLQFKNKTFKIKM